MLWGSQPSQSARMGRCMEMKAAPLGTSLLASTRIGALHVEPSSWCPTWSYAPITSLHKAPLVTHRIGSSILDNVSVGRVFRYVPAPD